MPNVKWIFLLLFVVACSNAGGSITSSSALIEDPSLPSQNTQAEQIKIGGLDIELTDGTISTIHRGTYNLDVSYTQQYNTSIFTDRRRGNYGHQLVYGGFDGEFVDGAFFVAYKVLSRADSAFAIEGTKSPLVESGLYSYRGSVIWFSPSIRSEAISTPIVMEADFNSGELNGWSVPSQSTVQFWGDIVGMDVDGRIYLPSGTHDFNGTFFGENAAEFAAYAQNGGTFALIYADFDQIRTDALN